MADRIHPEVHAEMAELARTCKPGDELARLVVAAWGRERLKRESVSLQLELVMKLLEEAETAIASLAPTESLASTERQYCRVAGPILQALRAARHVHLTLSADGAGNGHR